MCRVDTEDGQTVIYRANWYCQEPHFECEKWALEQCAQVGVPAPEMLYLNHDFEGHPRRSVCVLSFLDGRPLRALLNQKAISDRDYRQVLQQAGAWYGLLHTVATAGFGALDRQGRGDKKDWQSAYLHTLRSRTFDAGEETVEITRKADIAKNKEMPIFLFIAYFKQEVNYGRTVLYGCRSRRR